MAAGFSSMMKITDLDDFITPSLECIKPVSAAPVAQQPPTTARKGGKGLIQLEDDFTMGGPAAPQQGPAPPLQKATINLSDCLACSGCVTSAEVVLVTQQSHLQLRRMLSEEGMSVVLSVSPQAVLSLAGKFHLEPQDCARRLAGYFRGLGVCAVWDTNLARSIALLEAAKEFEEKFTAQQQDTLPILASACPGWICYAEKTQTAKIVQHISRCRSPQQIMGQLVNRVWAPREGKQVNEVYHVTVMPCYDKKLEASRLEFEDIITKAKDVDCVITSMEVEQMLLEDGTQLEKVAPVPLSPWLSTGELSSHSGSSAGGYADFILHYMARVVYDMELKEITWKTLKNADLQEACLEVGGEEKIKVCRAYGFRNLQNIVQKVKRGKSQYHYVEVMACPSGCLNGGAQIRPEDGMSHKELQTELEALYSALPNVDPLDDSAALTIIEQLQQSDPHFAHTTYKVIEKNITALGIKW